MQAGYNFRLVDSSLEEHFLSEYQQQESNTHGWLFYDDPSFSVFSPQQFSSWPDQSDQTQNGIQDILEPKKKNERPSSLASLQLLNDYANGFNSLSSERTIEPCNVSLCTEVADRRLSTVELVSMAGERFIQSRTARIDVISILDNPFGFSIPGLPGEEAEKVELAEVLLAAADKVGNQQFDHANRLLNLCDCSSSSTGNPVQRIVYYFSEALRMRIDREIGKIRTNGKCQSGVIDNFTHIPNSIIQACFEGIPFYQAANLTAIQAIVENVAEAKRVHVIDLKIRNGLHCIGLMQALASRTDRPLELLKITALKTTPNQSVEDTGKRLMSYAQAMNIPFSFKLVTVTDLIDLREELFEIDSEEAVAVYSEYALNNLIVQQEQLSSIIRVINYIRPCIMVVIDCEANHNSPVFVNRFTEALFYFSAYFDCIDACMEQDDPNRMIVESLFLGEGIRNIVSTEGKDRDVRNVKINVWRSFFAQFDMVEKELSESSLYQAKLVIKKFASGRFCTLGMDGKSLIFGWKGTPILSLSSWKFICQA
ncbi:DELLA protein RGL1-like isoform X2 [Euphorbia lathyris]|uniref:DELLA protein RGL1-like isoform X2 n=1 Tax=Euphorbia lathyris TaxID=212925 RepID=UPI0033135188